MESFKGGAGLNALNANMVERVEIITNPSARYEAEGMAGIINIILKKDNKSGFNGSFQLITGMPVNFGLSSNVNYRHKKINFFVNAALTYDINPYQGDGYQEYVNEGQKLIYDQYNSGRVIGFNTNIRGGLDYYFTEKSVLTASYLLSAANGWRYTENIYNDYVNSISNRINRIVRNQDEREVEPLSEYVLSYKRDFLKKGHNLTAQFRFLDHREDSDQLFTQNAQLASGGVDVANTFTQKAYNIEFERQYLFQLDYVKPLAKDGKIELGARSSLRNMVNDYLVSNEIESGAFVPDSILNNYFIYQENISAVYGIFGNKNKNVSYQMGLRSEWTDVTTTLRKTNEENARDYFNLFPSAHISYHLKKENSIQLSYSRRIRRPVYNDLSPFMTVSDSKNFFSGNPNLNPEYSDVFEIGNLKNFEKGSLTASLYYRNSTNSIERIREVFDNGNSNTLPQNLNGVKAYGIEFVSNYNPTKWLKTDFNFNLFHANIDGSNINANYVNETNSWFTRLTSRFILPKDLDLQLRANYNAAQKTAQGSQKAIYFFDFSLKKDIWMRKGTINFTVLDILNSRWMRSISEGVSLIDGSTFYSESNRQFRRRQFNLTMSYRIK